MSGATVSVTIQGLDSVKLVGLKLPDIPVEALEPSLYVLRDIGVQTAKTTLEQASSPKSTGETARRMKGFVTTINFPTEWSLRIGPETGDLPRGKSSVALKHKEYARAVSMDVPAVSIFRAVQIKPGPVRYGFMSGGTWRFIGIRPAIKGHPWMQNTQRVIERRLGRMFGKKVYEFTGKLDREQKQISLRGWID